MCSHSVSSKRRGARCNGTTVPSSPDHSLPPTLRHVEHEAQAAQPQGVDEALKQIGALYEIEEQIREQKLTDQSKRLHRLTHSKPRVDEFFDWVDRQFREQGLLPSSPFTQALNYVRERRLGLEVFLGVLSLSLAKSAGTIHRKFKSRPRANR